MQLSSEPLDRMSPLTGLQKKINKLGIVHGEEWRGMERKIPHNLSNKKALRDFILV